MLINTVGYLVLNMARKLRVLLNELVSKKSSSGEMLRALRKREGFTLANMQSITGVSESNISSLENDKIEMTRHYAEIFAAVLRVHPTLIMYPDGDFEKTRLIP